MNHWHWNETRAVQKIISASSRKSRWICPTNQWKIGEIVIVSSTKFPGHYSSHYALQLLLVLNVRSLHLVWVLPVLPLLEVDQVRRPWIASALRSTWRSMALLSSEPESASRRLVRIVEISSTSSDEMATTGIAAIFSAVLRLPESLVGLWWLSMYHHPSILLIVGLWMSRGSHCCKWVTNYPRTRRYRLSQAVDISRPSVRTRRYRLSADISLPSVMCHELVVVFSVVGGLSSVRDTLGQHCFLTGLLRLSSWSLA